MFVRDDDEEEDAGATHSYSRGHTWAARAARAFVGCPTPVGSPRGDCRLKTTIWVARKERLS